MIKKIKALVDAAKKGNALANPELWKNRQSSSNLTVMVVSFLLALVASAKTFGFDVPLDDKQITELGYLIAGAAGVVLGAFNWYLTLATSKKVGFENGEKNEL